jgi:hypothetical protein
MIATQGRQVFSCAVFSHSCIFYRLVIFGIVMQYHHAK